MIKKEVVMTKEQERAIRSVYDKLWSHNTVGHNRIARQYYLRIFKDWLLCHGKRLHQKEKMIYVELSQFDTQSGHPEVVDIDPAIFGLDAELFDY